MNAHSSILTDFLASQPAEVQPSQEADDAAVERALARARGQARAAGYEEGLAAARAEIDADALARMDAVRAAFGAADTLLASERAGVILACRRLFSAFFDAAAPSLARVRLGDEVAAALLDAVASPDAPVLALKVAPDAVEAMRTLLDQLELSLSVEPDETVATGAARLYWAGGFDEIVAAEAVEQATALLDQRLADAAANTMAAQSEQPIPSNGDLDHD